MRESGRRWYVQWMIWLNGLRNAAYGPRDRAMHAYAKATRHIQTIEC